MLSKTFTLLFFLRKPKNYVNGKVPIYIRFTVDGSRIELATKRDCEPEKWNPSIGRKFGTKDEARSLNSYLDSLQLKVFEAHRRLIDAGTDITAEAIKGALTGATDQTKMILGVFSQHNKEMEALVGKDFAKGTYNRYEAALRNVREFLLWKYKVADLPIEKLDYELISSYAFYLKSQRNISHNTTMKYLVYFKKIVLICVKNNWISKDPFFAFNMSKREVDRHPLNEMELRRIQEKHFSNDRLRKVRDIFLFSCFTGLAYVDVYKLRKTELIDGFDGKKWLSIKRQKTDTPANIPILPAAQKILDRYKGHPQCASTGRLLPVMTNQRMNSYLKEIADVCEINRPVTFHLARHTFATTVTLANNVPIESISKMLGHRKVTTTQIYAKIVDKKISSDMRDLEEILTKKSYIEVEGKGVMRTSCVQTMDLYDKSKIYLQKFPSIIGSRMAQQLDNKWVSACDSHHHLITKFCDWINTDEGLDFWYEISLLYKNEAVFVSNSDLVEIFNKYRISFLSK
ncbi:site-specific integrase [Dyadobacter sp. 32]|uniref:site-specific integrase n=1 Tax=Dyadobacter sp. 32 TaxID=538966 RepID=UPI0011F045FB